MLGKTIRSLVLIATTTTVQLATSTPVFCSTTQAETFKKAWVEQPLIPAGALMLADPRLHGTLRDSNCGSIHPMSDYYSPIVLRYFESSKLGPNSNLSYLINFKDGQIELKNKNSNQAEQFYCEQAIWEATPFEKIAEHPPISQTCEFTNKNGEADLVSDDSKFFQEHPELDRKSVVVAHVIPASAADIFTTIRYSDLYSVKNLSAIKLSDIHGEQLAAYRKEWINYINERKKNPLKLTQESLVDQAAYLKQKYHTLFLI